MPAVFLTAEWRWLLMINYVIDPPVLAPFIPRGTELDLWHGEALVTVVGFLFRHTRVFGVRIPWHSDFEEINLRFYVRRREGDAWRRGVVFINEIVPRRAIAWVARVFYNENYVALPMRHALPDPDGGALEYAAYSNGRWHILRAVILGEPQEVAADSAEEFITEHYWGYSRQPDGGTIEYQVEHPRWCVRRADEPRFDAAGAALYGGGFAEAFRTGPRSAFAAEGSPVIVRAGVRLR